MNVLVVDDEIPIREKLKAFPWHEYEFKLVGEAKNGKEAYEKCQAGMVDIVITDIGMPIMDGLELIRLLKESKPHIQCVLLTCHSDFEYARQAISLGACDYLVKGMYRDKEMLNALEKARTMVDKERKINQTAQDQTNANFAFRYEINQAITYIDQHMGTSLMIKDIANHVGLSYSYFGQLFKEVTGEYFQDYVKRVRMVRAAELLRQTNLKVYEISNMIGIPNYRYFTDCFSKFYGVSPREYRG